MRKVKVFLFCLVFLFFISAGFSQIKVTSPNGGENWKKGTSHNITWTPNGVSGKIIIKLMKGNTMLGSIAWNIPNSGSYKWTIQDIAGTPIAPGNDYKVLVRSFEDHSIQDMSNSNFTISSSTLKPVMVKKKTEKKLQKKEKPIKALYNFEIQGVKRVLTTPSNVKFQVQYYISPNYPKACYIGGYIPDQANLSAKFAYNPAGRKPDGIPKGQKHFTDNVNFEMKYLGPGTYTSDTIEVVIYDKEKILDRALINWGQTWSKEQEYRFEIQGIKRIYTSSHRVRFQVQYYIDPAYSKACYIGAYIPDKENMNRDFSYVPAGRSPDGVPKGQVHFVDNISFVVQYNGDSPYTSDKIQIVIYDSDKNLKYETINWGQTWDRSVY